MSRLADLPVATTQLVEASPHRMSDDAKVAFADNSILLGRRNGIEPEITEQPVEVALHPVPGWLQAGEVFKSPLFPLATAPGGFGRVIRYSSFRRNLLLSFLRGLQGRVSGSSTNGGTIEEGVFYALLCYTMLCYAVLCYVYQGT